MNPVPRDSHLYSVTGMHQTEGLMAREAFDFRPLEAMYPEWEAQFRAGDKPGQFGYRPGQAVSIYGPTDMLISRATIGQDAMPESEREGWAATINRFQRRGSGWYTRRHNFHFRSHTAAYAVAALHLLGRKPAVPVQKALRIARSPESTRAWLSRITWSIIWPASHEVAGLPAILHMSSAAPEGFWDSYFDWLDQHVHPQTGFWSRGFLQRTGLRPALGTKELGGAFHMYFIYEIRGRRWPLAERVVDAAIALQQPNGLWDGEVSYCIDLDGLYSAIRSSRNAGWYRKDDVVVMVKRYLAHAQQTLCSREFLFARYPGSHGLPGALSAVAECQKWFPELVQTERPWRQTLDSAPFI